MVGNKRRDNPSGPTKPYYVCRLRGNYQREYGCGRTRRYAIPLEHFIKQAVLYRLNGGELARIIGQTANDSELMALIEKRSALLARKEEISEMYGNHEFDTTVFRQAHQANMLALEKVDTDIAKERCHLAGLDIDPGENLRSAWDGAESDEWRRRLLSLIIERVDLLPGRDNPPYYIDGIRYRFDPSRVKIVWKV